MIGGGTCNYNKIIQSTSPCLIGIYRIITCIPDNKIFNIYCAAKILNAIILIGNNFDVFDDCF